MGWTHCMCCALCVSIVLLRLTSPSSSSCSSTQRWMVWADCDARVSKTGMSVLITPRLSLAFYISLCDVPKSTIQSHLSLSSLPPCPSVYSWFFVSFFPQLSRGAPNGKFRSGTAIRHFFQHWAKGACTWNGIAGIDLQVIVTLTATSELLLDIIIGHQQELFLYAKTIKVVGGSLLLVLSDKISLYNPLAYCNGLKEQ